MWRLIDRYIFKEAAKHFLLSLLLVTVVVLGYDIGRLAELFVKKNIPPDLVRTFFVAALTRVLVISMPVSLVLGNFLALGRLSGDGELIGMLVGGASRVRLMRPIMALSLIVCLAVGFLTLVELPRTAKKLRQLRGDLLVQGIRLEVKPRILDVSFPDRVLYVNEIDRKTDTWRGVFLSVRNEAGEQVLFAARKGVLEVGSEPGSSQLHLLDGVSHRTETGKERLVYHTESFSSYHVRLGARIQSPRFRVTDLDKERPISEMSTVQLLRFRSNNDKQRVKASIELNRRFSLPLTCVIFAPIGLAFGLTRRRGTRSMGFAFSVALMALYYLLVFGSENLASAGTVPPLFAGWSANLGFVALMAASLKRKNFFDWLEGRLVDTVTLLTGALRRTAATFRRSLPWVARRLVINPLGHRGGHHLDRYIGAGLLKFLLLSTGGLLTVFLIFTAFELSSETIENRIPPRLFLRYLLFLIPAVLRYLVPLGVLVSTLFLFSLLTRRLEATAFVVGGLSLYRVSLPALVVCAGLVPVVYGWQEAVTPPADRIQDRLRYYIKHGEFAAHRSIWVSTPDGYWLLGGHGRVFAFRDFVPAANRLLGPRIYDLDRESQLVTSRIEAERADWDDRRKEWVLANAQVWEFDRDKLVLNQRYSELRLGLEESPAFFLTDSKRPEYMSSKDLAAYISKLAGAGLDTTDLRISLAQRYGFPFSCLTMALVGIPFGFAVGRRTALTVVGAGLGLGLAYWLMTGFFYQLGRYEYLNDWLAAWSGSALFGCVGLFLLFRLRT